MREKKALAKMSLLEYQVNKLKKRKGRSQTKIK